MTQTTRRAPTIRPLLVLLAVAATTPALLIVTRPALLADHVVAAGLWWGAVVGSAWLAGTTIVCVAALVRGRTRSAQRIARLAPPVARRVLQAALVSTWVLVPTAAYAARSSAPITVHVDDDGRMQHDDPGESGPPVVHTPETVHRPTLTSPTPTSPTRPIPSRRATTVPTTTVATPTSPTTTLPTVTIPKAPTTVTSSSTTTTTPLRPASSPPAITPLVPSPSAPSPAPASAPIRTRSYVVVPGDNLWQIARAEVVRVSGTSHPDDAHIARYWQRVMAANRSTLRSGDPSLIFPGEVVRLP